MYAYVGNNPLGYSDPLGLSWDGYVSINSPGVQSQLASNIGNHYYSLWILLCADGCTTTDAFNAMRNFSAPFAPPAQDGIHKVNLYGITSSNPIKQTVDPCRQTIVNETLTGHLFGGSVTISILQENGVIGAQIVGTGLGPNPVTNQLMGPVIFEGLGFRARESLQGSGP